MSEPIHSSSWTGPPPEPTVQRPLFGYNFGLPGETRVYELGASLQPIIQDIPSELRPQKRAAAYLLFSPIVLWLSCAVAHLLSPESLWTDQSWILLILTALVIWAAVRELQSRSVRRLQLRKSLMFLIMLAMVGCAVLYAHAALDGYRQAKPSSRERTYEITVHRSKLPDYTVHQRADGSTVEGISRQPVVYSSTCAEVQRLQAPNGFMWVRVVDRSPAPAHEVLWPIRPEDCFSSKPLASLHG
jgi:hypothetical protein